MQVSADIQYFAVSKQGLFFIQQCRNPFCVYVLLSHMFFLTGTHVQWYYTNTHLQAPHNFECYQSTYLGRKYEKFLCACSYQEPFVKLFIFVTESGGKSTNYHHLVRSCWKIYKSTVKLKEMALPQKLKGSPIFCDHQNNNLLCFSVNNSDWHFHSVYVTPHEVYIKEVWFLMGFYLISFELAKIQMQDFAVCFVTKGNVSFCHHLASVVVNFSHFNLLL